MNLLMFSGDSAIAQGQDGAFYQMLRRFARHWARIDILTPSAPGAANRVLHERVFVHPSPWHRALQPLFIRHKGAQLLSERHYAVVVSHDFGFFYNGIGAWWLLRDKPHLPLISEIHHIEGYPIAVSWREHLWRQAARVYLPLAARRVAAFRTVNRREVPDFLRQLGIPEAKILVLPSVYLDFEILQPQPDVPKIYDVLFVGRLAANKGIDVLLKALVLVKEAYPDVRLAIRGEGALKTRLDTFIHQTNLQANVVFVPRVTDSAAMASLYQSAKMLVCASTVEGNPRVTLEAMACGVPVLSTPVGIMPDVIQDGENGFLFSRAAQPLAEKICRLLDNPMLQAQFSRAGRATAQQFDAETTLAQYAQAYQQVAAQHKKE
jgi:glycosyltransferase involved in cell wall biosynthesis